MAIFRENHKVKGDFTQISNTVICDTRISGKAKSYLILMLSRPDTWKFNMNGLLHFIKEGRAALQSGIDELVKFGYLKRKKIRTNGHIDYTYEIYENPTESYQKDSKNPEQDSKPESETPVKKQPSENQRAENHFTENQRQKSSSQKTASHSNTDGTHTETNNTDLQKEKDKSESTRTQAPSFSSPKRKFGSYQNVPLTDEEYQNLCDYYGPEETNRSIEGMSKYVAVNGKKYNNIAVKLEQWIEEDIEKYGFIEPAQKPTSEEIEKMLERINGIMMKRGWKTASTETSASLPVLFPKLSGQYMAVRA